jgi:hypothetical protein
VTLDGGMKLLADFESFGLELGVELFAGEDETLVFAQIWVCPARVVSMISR